MLVNISAGNSDNKVTQQEWKGETVVYIWIGTWLVDANGYMITYKQLGFNHPQKEHPILPFKDYIETLDGIKRLGYKQPSLINSVMTYYDVMTTEQFHNLKLDIEGAMTSE
jgi:hypothetical protein